jgi:hypothetical protein
MWGLDCFVARPLIADSIITFAMARLQAVVNRVR